MVRGSKLLHGIFLLGAALCLLACGASLAPASETAEGSAHAASITETNAAQQDHGTAAAAEHGDEDAHSNEDAQGAEDEHGAHAADHQEHSSIPHLTSWLAILIGFLHDDTGQPTPTASLLKRFTDPIFSAIGAILLMLLFAHVNKRRSQYPGRLQMAVEVIVGGLYDLFETVIGPHARRYTPYLGTLFLFILINNLLGLVPFMHSSTSAFNTTFALGVCTFLYVQGIAIKENGIGGYLHHMAGSPRSGLEWGFVILLFPLHLLGEFIKPISLSLRLFGNIFGEDTLIATMVMLGGMLLAFLPDWLPLGMPLQFPFMFLGMLTSTIQALVFTLLSTVYIALMLPHEEDHGGGEALGH